MSDMERQPTDGIFGLKGDRLYGCQCYYGPPDKVHVHVLGQVVEILGVTLMGREQAGPEKADIQKSTVSEAVSNSPAPVSCVLTCPVREGLERISDRRMWHRLNGELTWRGQTADGNEIEVEDPRDIARMALAAPCLGPPAAPSEAGTRPKIVCLCGSTRFMEAFFDEGWRLTLEGKIVLSVGVAKHADVDGGHAGEVLGPNVCAALDELHLRKIDLADEVLVLNVGGYIGESTRREIAYAIAPKKPVRY